MEHVRIGAAAIELQTSGRQLLGLGRITIDGTVVRSGELPLRPFTQTLDGLEYDRYEVEDLSATANRLVIRTRALATAGAVHVQLDHSLDPIWSARPWDGRVLASDTLEWILERAERKLGDRTFEGFRYYFRFRSARRSVWYLLDRASWELDGRAEGLTLLRQQMGEDPCVTLRKATPYRTAADIPFPLNPVMTYDVPRWASEQGFDYQYRGANALVGLFDAPGLVRTVVTREPGSTCVLHFDKHIFDAARRASTIPKFIGLARGLGDATDQLNQWTRVFDADQDNVLQQHGMRRPQVETMLSQNLWHGFTAESYRQDLLPAAAALGVQKVFIDPFWQNDMTRAREGTLRGAHIGNMCCPHEYEVAEVLGGPAGYRRLVADFEAQGVALQSWIGSHQSYHSPLLAKTFANCPIRLPDGRHWWKSGYDCIVGMDLTTDFGPMFQQAVIRAARATGVRRFLYDSFYNFGFMPVSYYTADPAHPTDPHKGEMRPHTQWRALLAIMAAWQRAGLHLTIESLGPWGQGQHGVQGRYDRPGAEALAYQCSVGIGYSVIPAPGSSRARSLDGSRTYYRFLANKAPLSLGLFGAQGQRADAAPNAAALRQANDDYRAALPCMHRREILPEGAGVLWTAEDGRRQALFAYRTGTVGVAAGLRYRDLTAGTAGTVATDTLRVQAQHTYLLEAGGGRRSAGR